MTKWLETAARRDEKYVFWVENAGGDIVMQPTFSENLAKNYVLFHEEHSPKHYFYVVRARLNDLEEMTY